MSATSTGVSSEYQAGATFSVSEDTTFNYQPGFGGVQQDWVEVGLTGALTGTVKGTGLGGTGSGRARVSVSGNLYTAPPEDGGTPLGSLSREGFVGGSVRSFNDTQTITGSEFVSTGFFWVRRGETVNFSASLGVSVFSDRFFGPTYGTVTSDFSDTFEFDPYSFFDIRTPGVTANSPSIGLFNNQLVDLIEVPDEDPGGDDVSPVPLPASLPMIGAALIALGGLSRRRRS